MSWLAPLWLEHLDRPLCVLVMSLQPGLLATQLAEYQDQQGREWQLAALHTWSAGQMPLSLRSG